ncbi:MAG: oxygenase MpaB family protein [Pseudomonadota bacterium]
MRRDEGAWTGCPDEPARLLRALTDLGWRCLQMTMSKRAAPSTTQQACLGADGSGEALEEESEAIARRLYALDFSWDIQTSLQFALFRTYAVPSISGLLARTGEFRARPRKRYDDTELILAEAMEHGQDSARGRQAIGRMNAMHARFRIRNDDMLYVLSTFMCEPVRWLERFGRRPMTATERQAWFDYYRALGQRMGILDIPESLDEMMRWNIDYEAASFDFAESNRQIAQTTRDLLLGMYVPRWLFFAGRPAVHALLDDRLRLSMGLPAAPAWLQHLVMAGLHARSAMLRVMPRRRKPRLLTSLPRPTYPAGYRIDYLGTFGGKAPPSGP